MACHTPSSADQESERIGTRVGPGKEGSKEDKREHPYGFSQADQAIFL
jgi:hypothetical protein